MKELASRLAMQHLINAYSQETGSRILLEKYQQNSTQLAFSQGLTLLIIPLESIQSQLYVPLSYRSLVGRHRIEKLPQIFNKGQVQRFSPIAMVCLLLEELVRNTVESLDSASLVEKWIQSRDALAEFLKQRQYDFDQLIQAKQDFIQTEQALILGHSMHPVKPWIKTNPQGHWNISANYAVEYAGIGEIFVQNMDMHSHGVGTPDLGLGAYRAATIANQLIGYALYDLAIAPQCFQHFDPLQNPQVQVIQKNIATQHHVHAQHVEDLVKNVNFQAQSLNIQHSQHQQNHQQYSNTENSL